MIVEFTKDLSLIKKIPTKYWSFVISFLLLIVTNVALGSFKIVDIVLYILTSSIGIGSNGLSNINELTNKNEKF